MKKNIKTVLLFFLISMMTILSDCIYGQVGSLSYILLKLKNTQSEKAEELKVVNQDNKIFQNKKDLSNLSLNELEKEAKNNPEAQVLMGDKYLSTVIDIHNHSDLNEQKAAYNKAYKYYLKAAKVNNPKGQFGVGKAIKYLRDGSADDRIFPGEEDVLSWYQKAADQNLAEAQYEFGNIYRKGGYDDNGHEKNIIPRNINTSIEYYHKAAQQNYPEAQYELAMIYKYSKSGIKKDFEKYKFWMFKSADNGYYKAQNEVAMDYMTNYFSRNLEQALIWAKKAYDKIPTEFRMTNLGGYDIWHMNVYDKIKEAIYEDARYKEAAKQGSDGIAKLEKLREKEMSDWNKAYDEREKQRVDELAEYRNQIRNEKAESEARAEKEFQAKKWAQADQQRSLDAQDKKLQQGYREINAMANPTSIDAINLAAENRAKNAAFYESVERNKKTEEENSSSNSKPRIASNNSTGNTSTLKLTKQSDSKENNNHIDDCSGITPIPGFTEDVDYLTYKEHHEYELTCADANNAKKRLEDYKPTIINFHKSKCSQCEIVFEPCNCRKLSNNDSSCTLRYVVISKITHVKQVDKGYSDGVSK